MTGAAISAMQATVQPTPTGRIMSIIVAQRILKTQRTGMFLGSILGMFLGMFLGIDLTAVLEYTSRKSKSGVTRGFYEVCPTADSSLYACPCTSGVDANGDRQYQRNDNRCERRC